MIFIRLFLFLILLIILLLTLLMERFLRKKFSIEKKKGFYQRINKVHERGEVIIVLLVLITMYLWTFIFNKELKPYYFIAGLIVLNSFRALMEWMYDRESKQYILTIFVNGALISVFLIFEILTRL